MPELESRLLGELPRVKVREFERWRVSVAMTQPTPNSGTAVLYGLRFSRFFVGVGKKRSLLLLEDPEIGAARVAALPDV